MKTLKIFGWISHFLFASTLLLSIYFGILIYKEYNSERENEWLIKFMNNEIIPSDNKPYLIVFMLLCYMIYLMYFYAIFLFNLCVRKFEKRIFFDLKIITWFRRIGLIFISNYILTFLLGQIFVIHSNNIIQSSTNFSELLLTKLEAPLGSLILGFFFLVLSQVFKEAKIQKEENIELKQENDLTI